MNWTFCLEWQRYFDEKMIETLETLGCADASDLFVKGDEGRETIELFTHGAEIEDLSCLVY